MTNENKALDQRYADRFAAFIGNTTENEQQRRVAEALLHELNETVPGIFRREGKLDIIDLGCGPGQMVRSFQQFFEGVNPDGAWVNALEMNRDHLVAAQRHLSDSVIIPEDIFQSQPNIREMFGLRQDPAAVFVSHSGYYGYDKDRGIGDQPKLEALADNVANLMGKNTIAFVQHKAPEPTNALKRKYANIVESDTAEALGKIFEKRGMRSFPLRFEAVLNFPEVKEGLWQELKNPKPYPQSDYTNGKEVRDLLEFLVHKGLEEMSTEERHAYLKDARELIAKHNGHIPTFIEQRVVVSPGASRGFTEKVKAAVNNVAQEYASKMEMAA